MCQRNRDGSFATQHDRERLLTMVANQLHEDGFRNLRVQGLRTKQIEHLVSRWQAELSGERLQIRRCSRVITGIYDRYRAHAAGRHGRAGEDRTACRSRDQFVDARYRTRRLCAGRWPG